MFSFKFDSIALDQDQDPNWTKILDQDPNSMYLDPKHCSLDPTVSLAENVRIKPV